MRAGALFCQLLPFLPSGSACTEQTHSKCLGASGRTGALPVWLGLGVGQTVMNPGLGPWSWRDTPVQVSMMLLEIPAWSLEGHELGMSVLIKARLKPQSE